MRQTIRASIPLFSIALVFLITACESPRGDIETGHDEQREGQELILGDTSIVNRIRARTSEIYNRRDTTLFALTNEQLRQGRTYGIHMIGYASQDTINRVIATSMTQTGQRSTEWYFWQNQLIYAYETFEYFDEDRANARWQNFKGLHGWESRYYFIDEEIKCQKHKGRDHVAAGHEANKILEDGRRILSYLEKRRLLLVIQQP